MIIVFEGAKGSGKSTAINSAAELLSASGYEVEVMKFERGEDPEEDMIKEVCRLSILGKSEVGFKKVYIIDRFHISEYVYRMNDGKFPIDEKTTTSTTILVQRMLLAARATVVILFCSDEDTRLERLRDRDGQKDEWEENTKTLGLWRMVTEVFKTKYHNVVAMDTLTRAPDQIASAILSFVDYSNKQTLHIKPTGDGHE